jgi:DNA-binding SARP family transcriptional activator
MTDVSEWAKREARGRYEVQYSSILSAGAVRNAREQAFEAGAKHLAALLLSDEAVEAAAVEMFGPVWFEDERRKARKMLLAAVSAVTTTNRESEARND